MMKNTGAVCNWASTRKPRLVPSEAVKANRSICDGPVLCLYDTTNSCMFLCVKFEPVVSATPPKSRLPYCGGWRRTKVRASDGVSGSDMDRESGLRMMVAPCGTERPLLVDRDGRMRSTISTAISKLPLRLVLPLLTTNLCIKNWVSDCLVSQPYINSIQQDVKKHRRITKVLVLQNPQSKVEVILFSPPKTSMFNSSQHNLKCC